MNKIKGGKLRRTVVLLVLAVVFSVVFGSATAHAGGWFKSSTTDTVGDSYWKDGSPETNATDTVTPHLGFSTTSNQCRVCHAVHLSGDESYRLLKDGTSSETRTSGELTFTPENTGVANTGKGNSRSTECMYCHDSDSGASSKRPYDLSIGTTKTVRGEHSLGATWIPDSSVNDTVTPEDGRGVLPRKEPGAADSVLDCYQCHSVHGAKILTNITGFGWGEIQPIDNYILREDPAGNGGDANTGIDSIRPPWDSSASAYKWVNDQSKDTSTYPSQDATAYLASSIWKYEVQVAWCGDCHNENPNITGPGDFRPNNKS
ncbi:MAG: hypothetical protein KAX16_01000, partial [Actinomycetia bacterium]|nr:hypothetical protein [Actinomycetes bacterium]